jgi:SAM domain (Sterile alpha motif)
MDVGDFLRELGLQQYEAAFRDNRIDIRVLPKLTAEDLKDLGVTLVGDRRMLLDAIAALHEPTAPAAKVGADGLEAFAEVSATGEAERRPISVMFCDLHHPVATRARDTRHRQNRCQPPLTPIIRWTKSTDFTLL